MKIAIIGQGGHSKVIQDLISMDSQNQIVAFLDDKYKEESLEKDIFLGPITSAKKVLKFNEDTKFIIAVGNNHIRKMLVEKLDLPKEYYQTLIHPTAIISLTSKIGHGSVIMPNSVVNANALLGDHVIINTGSIIEHDNVIEDYVHISPNAALTGATKIREGVHVGAGATVIPNVEIGEWSVIGAGATVINNIPAGCTAVGVPAKIKNKLMIEGV